MSWDDWTKTVLTAALGFLAGLSAQWWRASRDDAKSLTEDLCTTLEKAAAASAECWLSEKDDPKRHALEAQVRGLQERMLGISTAASARYTRSRRDEVRDHTIAMMRAMTGGNFHERDRPAQPDMAGEAHVCAARAIVIAKRAFVTSASLKGTFKRFWEGK